MTLRTCRRSRPIWPWRRGAASAALALLASLLPLAAQAAQARGSCLEIVLLEKGGRLTLRASDGKADLTVASERSVNAIAKEFLKVYEALDGNQGLDARFDARLELLSVELLGPLRPALREAACVVFEINPRFLHFALDLLPVDGEPLFLAKPTAFALSRPSSTAIEDPVVGGPLRGLIVRDPETDPEDGAGEAQRLFPASDLLHIEQADPRMFAHADYDFLLISAYGSVTPSWGSAPADEDDVIELGERDMEADALDGSRFKLVYLDSSQLGISESFIASARRNGVRHFLAPLINNEADNSSTLMIRYFFGGLSQGRSPMDALFQARRRIHQEFLGRAGRTERLYFAYPFRLYLL